MKSKNEDTQLSEVTSLEHQFRAWCERETLEGGRFTIKKAWKSGFGSERWIRESLVNPLIEEGLIVEVGGRKGFLWTLVDATEVMSAPFARFAQWAAQETRARGRFGIRGATKARLGTIGEARYFVARAVETGLAAKLPGAKAGYEWLDVDVSWDPDAALSRSFISDALMDSLRSDFVAWGRARDCFTYQEVVERFRIGYPMAHRLVDPLVAQGSLVALSSGHGSFAWQGRVRRTGTLADLMRTAEAAIVEGPDLQPGSKPKGVTRSDGRLSKSQARDLKGAAYRIAREVRLPPDSIQMSDELFGWDESISEGEWIIVDRMRSWTMNESKANRRKLVTGIKLLVDFAAAIGAIAIDSRVAQAEVYAAEWQPFIDEVLPVLMEANEHRNALGMRKGVEMLTLAATRRGELAVEDTNWAAVRDFLESRLSAAPGDWHWKSARQVYRHLLRLDVIRGPAWPMPNESRRALVPSSSVTRAAETKDVSCWTTRDGRRLVGLTEELSKYLQWATSDPLELSLLDLPPHAYVNPTPPQTRYAEKMERRGRGDRLFQLVPPTLLGRLHWLNLYFGYLEDHDSAIDLGIASLDEVLDVRRLMAFGEYMRKSRETDDGIPQLPRFVLSLANALGVIASPFLERFRASAGDTEGAMRARANADRVRKYYSARKNEVRQKKALSQIIEAWKGSDGVEPWLKLLPMRDLELQRARAAIGLTMEEQVIALREGRLRPSMTWALSIRNAFLINFVRLIPLRRWTLSRLTTQMWVQEGVYHDQMNRDLAKHEGSIMVEVPGPITKNKSDFRCPYIEKSVVGSFRHEYGAHRAMLELYWSKGGAREYLLRTPEGEQIDSPYVFVAPASKVGGRDPSHARRTRCRWKEGKMSEYFSVLVFRHGKALNLDLRRLSDIGGTRLHIARGLFGSYHAPRDLVMTADVLHHGDVRITKAKYCEDKAETAKREAPAEFIDQLTTSEDESAKGEDPTERIRRLEEENAELRTQVASLPSAPLRLAS